MEVAAEVEEAEIVEEAEEAVLAAPEPPVHG